MSIAGSKVFITGGAGFIGTRLAQHLSTDNEIVLFDNLHNDAYRTSELAARKNVRLVVGDIRDAEAVGRAMTSEVEYVIHAAAIAGVATVLADPVRVLEVNVKGTFNVVEAALRLPRLVRFVDLSTSEVYGRAAENVDERALNLTVSVGEARWTYALSKLTGEFLIDAHHTRNGLPSVTIRPFNVYGPNQVGAGAVHHFVRRAIAGDDLVVHEDGSQVRAWCYIDDFVRGALDAIESSAGVGRTYNIGDPASAVTVRDLAEKIIGIAGSSSRLVFKPIGYAEVVVRIPNISAARADFGFEPQIGLDEGLARTIDWYRSVR